MTLTTDSITTRAAARAAVTCDSLSKAYGRAGGRVQAVREVSLTLEAGQFVALLGPSGCGKTTVLRLIAGLETPDSGCITIGGRLVAGPSGVVPAHQRRVGMVFQDYALFPHMTVEQNIAYGLTQHGPASDRVGEMLDLVGLGGTGQRFPHELSGGQQQRVALARALAPQPEILLLDEPFSNLDVALRTQVREDVQRILQGAGVSAILVTHDQDEAMSMADRVALMFDGAIAQVGTPRDLYEQPVSRRAAQFLGEANILPGTARGLSALTALGDIPLQHACQGEVEVMIRPEHLSLHPAGSGRPAGTPARVTRCMYYGTHQDVWVELAGSAPFADTPAIKVRCSTHDRWHAGEHAAVRFTGQAAVFPQG